jgi:hypothetical protein
MDVYMLWARQDYESSVLLEVYANEGEANAVCAACIEHQAKKPESAADGSTDAEIEAAWKADEEWSAAHPGGTFGQYADGYAVSKWSVKSTNPKP